MGSLEALGGVGGCHACEGYHCWNKGIHESGYRSRKELREGIREVAVQEIESGLLNSQFGVFIKAWIRHLGLMRLSDVGLAGPLLMSVDLCCGQVANCRRSCSLWVVEGANFASGSVVGVTPCVIQSLLHLIW